MLTKEEFYRKLADVTEAVFPSKKPYELSSIGIDFHDVMYNELANRESGNRTGLLSVSYHYRYHHLKFILNIRTNQLIENFFLFPSHHNRIIIFFFLG